MATDAPMLCPACGASLDSGDRRCRPCGYTSVAARWIASPIEEEARGARVQSRVDAALAGLLFAPGVALATKVALGSTRPLVSLGFAGFAFASSALFAQRARDNLRAQPLRSLWSYANPEATVVVTSSIDPYSREIRVRGSQFDRAVHSFDPRWATLRCSDESALALEAWAMGDGAMSLEDSRRWTLPVLALMRLAAMGAVDLVVQRSRVWTRMSLSEAIDSTPETQVIAIASRAGGNNVSAGDEFALERAMLSALERVAPDVEPVSASTPEAVHYRSAQIREGRVETPLATALVVQLPLVVPSEGDDSPVYSAIDGVLETVRGALEGTEQVAASELLPELEADRAVFRAMHSAFRAVVWDVGEYWDERT